MNGCRGFTLIEMMCVIAILGIILSISYPSIESHVKVKSGLNTRLLTEQLLFDIRYVRQQNINDAGVKYTLYLFDNHYVIKKSGDRLPVILKTVNVPYGITLSSNMAEISRNGIYFSATGAPSSAGSIYINRMYIITIQPSTGRALIKKL